MCKINNLVTQGTSIIFQVSFISIFSIIFYFSYIQKIERKKFHSELKLIVDDIYQDIKDNIPIIIKNNNSKSNNNIIYEKIKSEYNDIFLKKNKDLKLKTIILVIILICIPIITFIFTKTKGFCILIKDEIYKIFLLIIFIVLTQLLFLNLISKKYISIDPDKIKKKISKTILNWIQKNI